MSKSYPTQFLLWFPFICSVCKERANKGTYADMDGYLQPNPSNQNKKNGFFQDEVIRDYVPLCSMVNGKANPYYSLQAKPRKTHRVGRNTLPTILVEVDSKNLFDTTRSANSDLELSVKVAKMAFNQFMRGRTLGARKVLFEKINLIPIGQIEKRGRPFFQGGAPGLGKN